MTGVSKMFAQHLMNNYGVPPVTFVKGSGAYLWDNNGKKYLDFLCGLAVTSLGHCNSAVSTAIEEQASRLLHVSNLFTNEHQGSVAKKLDSLIGGGQEVGGKSFFCNSGTEANEAAIKLARKYGGPTRSVIVASWRGFHGRTLGSLAATGQPSKWEGFGPLPEGFRHVEWNNLNDLAESVDSSVGAILLEPIQAEGGVYSSSKEFFLGVRQICDENDILMMVDEVQTGMARTGQWFGFQHYGVMPDVVTVAKALGNGFPVGACWASPKVADVFVPGDHGSTFGGQPLAMSVASAVIDEMVRLDMPKAVEDVGAKLVTELRQLEQVKEVRGEGLLLAAELKQENSREVAAACLDLGLIVNAVTPSALRLTPPLVISETEISEAMEILQKAFKAV